MASNSPGSGPKKQKQTEPGAESNAEIQILSAGTSSDRDQPPGRARAGARASLSDKVGFFEQVFKSRQRSRSRGNAESPVSGSQVAGRESRVGVGYHGPRTDARDRSSEDVRRHRIPRASLSPPGERGPGSRVRSRSASRGRDMSSDHSLRGARGVRERLEEERRSQPSDDIPSSPGYRSISIKRTQSGRMLDAGHRTEFKPRALSFRVSPGQSEDSQDAVHQPLQPIFSQVNPSRDQRDSMTRDPRDSLTRDQRDSLTRDPSVSITQHIQAKVSREALYQKPPPLPERPPRQYQRHSEPALYSSPRVST